MKTYEGLGKPYVFGCFQGVEKGYIGNKWVNNQYLARINILKIN